MLFILKNQRFRVNPSRDSGPDFMWMDQGAT